MSNSKLPLNENLSTSTADLGCSSHERLINRLLQTDLYWSSTSTPDSRRPGEFLDSADVRFDTTGVILSLKEVRQLAGALLCMAEDMEAHIALLPHLRAAASRNRPAVDTNHDE
jgi:hypothetical protein